MPKKKWTVLFNRRWRYSAEAEGQAPSIPEPAPGSLEAGYSIALRRYKYRATRDVVAKRALRACSVAPIQQRDHEVGNFAGDFGIDAYDLLLDIVVNAFNANDAPTIREQQTLRETAGQALGSIRREWTIQQWKKVRNAVGFPSGHPQRLPLLLGCSLFALFAFPLADMARDISGKVAELADRIVADLIKSRQDAGDTLENANPADPFPPGTSKRAKAEKISAFLAAEGYTGNERSYYSVRNSLMHDVLKDKSGIPISLGLIFKAVAERLGLSVDMVSTPGHMLTRLTPEPGEPSSARIYIDMFQAGSVLTENQVRAMFAGPLFGLDIEEHLRAATDEEVMMRWARNILNAVNNRDSLNNPNVNSVFIGCLWAFAILAREPQPQLRYQLYRHVETAMPSDARLLEQDLRELEETAPGIDLTPLRTIVERMRENGDNSLDD